MTELQVKGLIGAMCNWLFGVGTCSVYGEDDQYNDLIIIDVNGKGKFIGSLN